MERSNKPTLLTLPPEIRNHIWELSLYHSQTSGLICPLQDARTLIHCGKRTIKDPNQHDHSHVLFSNVRLKIRKGKPEYPPPHLIPEVQISKGSTAPASCAVEDLRASFEGSPQGRSGHCCRLDCLVQPALTRVNWQVRAESLGYFYSANHFHLELDNFVPSPTSKRCSVDAHQTAVWNQRTPIDWWRALSPTNLQHIRRLSIGAQAFFAYEHNALVLDFDVTRGKVEMLQTYGAKPLKIFAGPQEQERLKAVHAAKEERLRELMDVAVKSGLSKELLNEVAQLLERSDRPVCS